MKLCFEALIEKKVENKKIPHTHQSPKQLIEFMKKYFKKYDSIKDVIPLYLFFRKVPDLKKTREWEFRKNGNLKVFDNNKVIDINLEKLTEYSLKIDSVVNEVRKLL